MFKPEEDFSKCDTAALQGHWQVSRLRFRLFTGVILTGTMGVTPVCPTRTLKPINCVFSVKIFDFIQPNTRSS